MMRLFFLLLIILCSRAAFAAQCSAVFPGALQGHADNGRLTLNYGAVVNNSPSTVLPFATGTITASDGNSCGSDDCSVSGFPSEPVSLNSFPSFTGYSYNSYGGVLGEGRANSQTFNSVNAFRGTTTFSDNYSQYFLQSLNISGGAKVAMKPGIYWIRTININGSNRSNDVAIEVVGSGTVYLVTENLYINDNRVINGITNDALLSINTYNNLSLNSISQISALVYSDATVSINSGSVFTGAIAAANVTLNAYSTVNYQGNLLNDFDLSALCEETADEQLRLEYEFDQQAWENAGDVVDSSGNNNSGTALGSATPQSYDGGTCRVLDIPANTTQGAVDAVNTRLDINEVGDTGSISFWYRSDLSWSNATRRQLFDASNDLTSPNKHFYLSLGGGTLQFSIEDENDVGMFATINNINADAGEWVHVTTTWDLPNKRIQVYLNTSDYSGVWYQTNNRLADRLGDLSSLYIGDSRSSYFLERSTDNSAHGQFESFHIFNYVLTNNEARTVAQATPSCGQADATLVAHWPIDVCSLNGASGEVIDVIGNLSGNAIDGVSPTSEGKFCQAGDFDGYGGHLNLPHGDAIALADGSVSIWFNPADLTHANDSSFDGMAIFSKESRDFGTGGHLSGYLQPDGSVHVRLQSTSNSYYLSSANGLVQQDQWHHLVFTFGSDGARLYLNNQLVASNPYTGGITTNAEPIIVGSGAWLTGVGVSEPEDLRDHFIGKIDDLRFYQGQLSALQIDELYNEAAGLCSECNVRQQLALYSFEQQQWDNPQDVLDTSGSGNHGSALGLNVPLYPSEQIACRAMDVPASSAITGEFNALDTSIDMDSLDGRGTISFWYRSNEAWNSGQPRQLFDASTTADNVNVAKYFYLAINSSGKLDFNMEDENDRNFGASTSNNLTFAADQWVHIAVTWDIANSSLAIFIDGVEQALISNNESNLSDTLGPLNSLYIGDNRTDYLVQTSTQHSANGQFDDIRIYSYEQTQSEVDNDRQNTSTCTYVYKYLIEHDGNGLTCDAEPVSIKACANDSCSELFSQQITVSMLPNTGWPDGATVTIPAGNAANVTYRQTEPGRYTFAVVDETTECGGNADNSCDIVFADAGFQFVGADIDQEFADQLAESPFSQAQIRAVKTDEALGTSQCVAALSGQQQVSFSMSCDDPSVCKRNITSAGNAISDSGFTEITLMFDSDGVASLDSLRYADAGQISLYAQAQLDNADLAVGSTQLVVYPDKLSLSSDFVANSAAGEDFSVTITAQGSEGGVLPNYQPSAVLASLTRLVPADAQSVEGILTYAQSGTLRSALTPSLSNTIIATGQPHVSVTDGVIEFDAFYNEYGVIALDIADSNYFSYQIKSDSGSSTDPLTLGTFTPAYYDVTENTPSLQSTCNVSSDFSYLGKDRAFSLNPELTVSAKNALGNTMLNFDSDDNWAWLAVSDPNDIEFIDSNFSGNIDFFAVPTVSVNDNGSQGSRTVTLVNGSLLYTKPDTPLSPFSSSLNMAFLPQFLTDNSFGRAICYQQSYTKGAVDDCDNGANVTSLDDTNNVKMMFVNDSSQYRWGRLRIDNGFGPENRDILLSVHSEYYNGSAFILNSDDSCTQLQLTAADFDVFDSTNSPTNAISVLDSDFTLVSGRTLGFEGVAIRNMDQSVMGEYRIELLPINDSTVTWDDYLQFDWNGEANGTENPSANVSFGQFRGNDRVIHWREVTN